MDPNSFNPFTLSVPVRLVPARSDADVTLRVLSPADFDAYISILRSSGERLAPRFVAAAAGTGDAARLLVRPASKRTSLPAAAWPGVGYVAHTHIRNLFIPDGLTLRPSPRPGRLAALLNVNPDWLTWLEPHESVVRAYAVPVESFRRPALAVAVPRRIAPAIEPRGEDPFLEAPFAVPTTGSKLPLPSSPPRATPPETVSEEGWVTRLVRNLKSKPKPDEPLTEATTTRVPPTESLAVGPGWAARRRELEGLILRALPRRPAGERARLWAELADVYAVSRRPADAALCWLNAIWDAADPPPAWLDGWVRDESRGPVAPFADTAVTAPATLAQTRFAAARWVRASYRGRTGSTSPAGLLRAVDTYEADLPVRLVWLVRRTAAPNDTLAHARARDSLVARLAGTGPALDRDAPAFLRFAGRPDGARDLRDWVLRCREPAKRWVGRVAGGGKLQWFGLDGETEATAAYAELLFAWAAGRTGERAAAVSGLATAAGTLAKCDGAVHAYLADAFRERVREARDGRPPRTAFRPFTGDTFDQFCVNKLRSRCRILDPARGTVGVLLPETDEDVAAWVNTLPHRVREPGPRDLDLTSLLGAALVVADRFATPGPVAVALEFLTGPDSPPGPDVAALLDRVGVDLFAACKRFELDPVPLVRRIAPPPASPGDVRSAVVGAGWLAAGDDDRGLDRLDACRERMYAVGSHDPRERAALAVATAGALGLAPARVALGRLEELFQRLAGIDVTGSTNRYFTLRPLEIIDTAIRAATGGETVPTPDVRDWLAADERVILSRVARDAVV